MDKNRGRFRGRNVYADTHTHTYTQVILYLSIAKNCIGQTIIQISLNANYMYCNEVDDQCCFRVLLWRIPLFWRSVSHIFIFLPLHKFAAVDKANKKLRDSAGRRSYAVQGYSRSLILVPIESPYATSC